MGGIADDHVEWAVANRLKAMLDDLPKTPFNITQPFAHFTMILLWTKNRMWVAGNASERVEGSIPPLASHKAHANGSAMRSSLKIPGAYRRARHLWLRPKLRYPTPASIRTSRA
jgi:hypothetical protein